MEGKSKAVDSFKVQESFFSQLRHLAGEVDTKVHFVKESKPEQCQENAGSNFFLVNTKKEIANAFEQVEVKYDAFDSYNSRFNRMQDLVKTVLHFHEKRIEKMQDYMKCYGYVKPTRDFSKMSLIKDSQIEQRNVDSESGDDEIEEDVDGKDPTSASSTLQSKTNTEKQFIRRTPKLEDVYCKLSEDTILLLKGVKSHSEEGDFSSRHTTSNSDPLLRNKTTLAESTITTQFESKEALLAEKFVTTCTSAVKERSTIEPNALNINALAQNQQTFSDYKLKEMSIGVDNSCQLNDSSKDKSDKYFYGKQHLSSLNTPQSMMKSFEQRKTPVFEDIYGMLSESTISLLKYSSHKSVSTENLKEKKMTNITDSFRDVEAVFEQNSILKLNDKSLSESNLNNCTPAIYSSLKECSKANASSQDIPMLGLSGLKQQNLVYSEHDRKNAKCVRSLLYSQPSTSENTTSCTSSYPYVSSIGKENLPSTKMFDSMPEPPKLLSRAIIQDLYNNKY